VEGGGRRCDPFDEWMIFVLENVEIVAKIRFRTLICPGTVATSPRFRLITPKSVCTGMTGIGGDKTRILNHASPDRQSFLVDLALQLFPDSRIFSCCDQAFTEEPDGRIIRDFGRIVTKVAERKAVICFTFELRIGKTIPLLKDEEF